MLLKELTAKIQVKLNQYNQRFTKGFSRPEQKFIHQMTFGILKSESPTQ